jgi:hypothetical protein
MASPAAREPWPLVTLVRCRTVAKVDSIVIWSPKGEPSGRSQLAEGFGELAAEPPVVLGELPVAFAGGLQPLPERWRCSPGRVSQLLDLVS